MEKLLDEVLESIKPNEEERRDLEKTSGKLIEKAEKVISELEIPIEPKLLGSAARETWLSDERDIDIFLLFPESVSRESLEDKGLEIGKEITGREGSEQYAEHPYINAEIEGFVVDVVPCYDIDDPTKLRSAVDRSPHHQEYVKGWLTPERADQVRLLKKFLMGIGVYGSELRVRGFSGYLSELLIVHYGSFPNLVEEVSEWGSNKIITLGTRDSEDLRKIFPDHPLIFVDPVDPGRNVAASVSKDNYATFVRACQDFVREPEKKFFFPKKPVSSREKIRDLIEARESKLYMISFELLFDLVPDIVYPQLRKTQRTLSGRLEDKGFEVLRSGVWSEERDAIILLELEVSKLPKVKEHLGPPLEVDSEPFIREHLDSEEKLAGPFVNEEGRLVFELERSQTRAIEVIREAMKSCGGFGKHVEKSVSEEGYDILEDKEVLGKAEEMNAVEFLGKYITFCLPWYR